MNDEVSESETTAANSASASAAVGALLRENRERAGLAIADVARVLRISQKYLEALETGRDADLPGTPYAIGFVRSYAEHLHLDGEEIVRRYKAEAEGLAGKTDLIFPKPIPDGGVPGAAVLGLGVIVAAAAYGVWYWNSNQGDVTFARVEAVPEHMAATEPTPSEQPESASESAVVEEVTAEPAPEPVLVEETAIAKPMDETPAQTMTAMSESAEDAAVEAESVVEEAQDAAETVVVEATAEAAEETEEALDDTAGAESDSDSLAAQAVAVETAEAVEVVEPDETPVVETVTAEPEPEAAALPVREDNGPSRVTVRAKSNSWIQVRDEIADRLLFTRLLREGDEYAVPDRSGLRLMTGNAGALELLVDGVAVPAIGDVGEVRRNVELDPDKLKSGSAVSE